jgi:N-acetyl-gamma-glutamyl-phosphate reductase
MIRTVVIGAGGYSGAELTALLSANEDIELVGLFASDSRGSASPARFGDLHPRWRGRIDLPILATDLDQVIALRPDAVFLATPHEVSHDLAPRLVDAGCVVLDLSGAFRLRSAHAYPAVYGFEHRYPELLASAAYGLPELNESAIAEASLIALPGCYPTSIILPLAPLASHGAIAANSLAIADSTSGVSGAGRTPALKSMFCEVSFGPYGVLSHRHAPEIELHSGAQVVFTPHLGPFDRGIVSTIHVTLDDGWDAEAVQTLYQSTYGAAPFVRLLPHGSWPTVAGVRDTNCCDIAFAVEPRRRHLIIVSAIDNLIKGAAGQAVQCFNIRFGLPQTAGLPGGMPCTSVH